MENIDIYYESLKQVYDQIVEWQERKAPLRVRIVNWLLGIALIMFLISLIPVLPAILVFVGSQVGLVLGPLDLSQATLGKLVVVWLLLGIGTFLFFLLMIWLEGKISSVERPARPPQTLSPEQVTFLTVYEAYKELKVFFVSHIDQHVNNSLNALASVTPSARERLHVEQRLRGRRLRPEEVDRIYLANGPTTFRPEPSASFPRQVSIAQEFLLTFEKYAWFQLDNKTKSTLQALVPFSQKVPPRLRRREDLPTVLSILENLSRFVYAYLPEHKANMNSKIIEPLHAQGTECLDRFVQEVTGLTQYAPEQGRPEAEEAPATWRMKVQRLYSHSVFLRFTIWFVVILLLTSGIVFLASQRIQQLDANVMVSMVIGTSATAAAALAAFTPRTPKPRLRATEEDRDEATLEEVESNEE